MGDEFRKTTTITMPTNRLHKNFFKMYITSVLNSDTFHVAEYYRITTVPNKIRLASRVFSVLYFDFIRI